MKPGDVTNDLFVLTEEDKISITLQHTTRLPVPHKSDSLCRRLRDRSSASRIAPAEDARDLRYLLCPANMTMTALKKFLRLKFNLKEDLQIEVFVSDEAMQESYTLMDVAYISRWTREGPLNLKYIVYDCKEMAQELPKIIQRLTEETPKATHKATHKATPPVPRKSGRPPGRPPGRGPGRPPGRKPGRKPSKCKTTVKSILESRSLDKSMGKDNSLVSGCETVAMDTSVVNTSGVISQNESRSPAVNHKGPCSESNAISRTHSSTTSNEMTICGADMEVAMEIQIDEAGLGADTSVVVVEDIEPVAADAVSSVTNVTSDRTAMDVSGVAIVEVIQVANSDADVTAHTPSGCTANNSPAPVPDISLPCTSLSPGQPAIAMDTALQVDVTDTSPAPPSVAGVSYGSQGTNLLENHGVIIIENESETISSCELMTDAVSPAYNFNASQNISSGSSFYGARNSRVWNGAGKLSSGSDSGVVHVNTSTDDEDSSYAKTIDIIENVENAHFALRNVVCIDADEPQVIEVNDRPVRDCSLAARLKRSSPAHTPPGGDVVNIIIGGPDQTSLDVNRSNSSSQNEAISKISRGSVAIVTTPSDKSVNVAKHQTLANLLAAPVSAPSVDSIVRLGTSSAPSTEAVLASPMTVSSVYQTANCSYAVGSVITTSVAPNCGVPANTLNNTCVHNAATSMTTLSSTMPVCSPVTNIPTPSSSQNSVFSSTHAPSTSATKPTTASEVRASLAAANITLPPGYIAIPSDGISRNLLSPRRKKTVKTVTESETDTPAQRLSPKNPAILSNKDLSHDVTKTAASSTVLDTTGELVGVSEDVCPEPATLVKDASHLGGRSNEVTSTASPSMDPSSGHDNKGDHPTKEGHSPVSATIATHVVTKATVETQTGYDSGELSPSSNAASSWGSSEGRKSPCTSEGSGASSPGENHGNSTPSKPPAAGSVVGREGRSAKSRERKSSKPVRINRSARYCRPAESVIPSSVASQPVPSPAHSQQAGHPSSAHIPVAHQNHGNPRAGIEAPPIKRLRQMCSGFESGAPACGGSVGVGAGMVRPWMYGPSPQHQQQQPQQQQQQPPVSLHGMLAGSGGVQPRGYATPGGYVPRALAAAGPYGAPFSYQEPSSAPGYDQPLELTTKRSRDRKLEEVEAEAKRKRTGCAAVPSLVRP